MGWFFGFKLHLIVSDTGELIDFALTAGNVDDRQPIPDLVRHVFGKLFGDKGYLSKTLREELWEQGVDLIKSIVALAPMLGLLGTVTGMIAVFDAFTYRLQVLPVGQADLMVILRHIDKPVMRGLDPRISGAIS